jgi:hypothetical protein
MHLVHEFSMLFPQPGSLYAEQSRNITCVRYWIGNVLTQVGVCIGMHVVLAL